MSDNIFFKISSACVSVFTAHQLVPLRNESPRDDRGCDSCCALWSSMESGQGANPKRHVRKTMDYFSFCGDVSPSRDRMSLRTHISPGTNCQLQFPTSPQNKDTKEVIRSSLPDNTDLDTRLVEDLSRYEEVLYSSEFMELEDLCAAAEDEGIFKTNTIDLEQLANAFSQEDQESTASQQFHLTAVATPEEEVNRYSDVTCPSVPDNSGDGMPFESSALDNKSCEDKERWEWKDSLDFHRSRNPAIPPNIVTTMPANNRTKATQRSANDLIFQQSVPDSTNCSVTKKVTLKRKAFIPRMIPRRGRRPIEGRKTYRCSHGDCEKVFPYQRELDLHVRTHTGEKPYVCEICNRALTQKSNLIRHKKTHAVEKNHRCSVCGKVFRRKRALKDHTRIHTGEKPYVCGTCNKEFNNKSNLNTHERIHTENTFSCSSCQAFFTNKNNFKEHLAIHTGNKRYGCDICKNTFARNEGLQKHKIRIHNR